MRGATRPNGSTMIEVRARPMPNGREVDIALEELEPEALVGLDTGPSEQYAKYETIFDATQSAVR